MRIAGPKRRDAKDTQYPSAKLRDQPDGRPLAPVEVGLAFLEKRGNSFDLVVGLHQGALRVFLEHQRRGHNDRCFCQNARSYRRGRRGRASRG